MKMKKTLKTIKKLQFMKMKKALKIIKKPLSIMRNKVIKMIKKTLYIMKKLKIIKKNKQYKMILQSISKKPQFIRKNKI